MKNIQAKYYEKTDSGKIKCGLCPHRCLITEGKTGICNVRENTEGTMTLPYYGRISAITLDPVMKKPLYHFYPGSMLLSIGFLGCSFRCPFCQNWSISQDTRQETRSIKPEEVVEQAVKSKAKGIAYTYSEPVVHIEYMLETAELASREGLSNVLVTNGHINKEPALDLLPLIDAANIDLKSFSESYYSKVIGGSLEAVKEFIALAYDKCSLEVTTLIVPGDNDSETEIKALVEFLSSLSPEIPYHMSRYHPAYKYDREAGDINAMTRLKNIAREKLDYVYLGNMLHDNNTYCPGCGTILAERSGSQTRITQLSNGKCDNCGRNIPIVM